VSRRVLAVAVAALALLGAACANSSKSPKAAGPGEAAPVSVRLGYFPNLTHATAVVGVQQGIFARALGPDRLQTATFNAGPAAVEALFSGALDATYIGPNPTINAFVQSKGKAVRIIAGATSGGASLVVRPAISSPADLKGKKLASPQLGGTQDVALRWWLAGQGLKTDVQGGGDVSISPQENAQTLETFRSGAIDGAWVPEPWATRLVQEGGGKVLVDERDLWPDHRFVTTQLIVRTAFLQEHPDAVRRLLEGQLEANTFVNEHPAEAQAAVNEGIARVTGKKLPEAVVKGAWGTMSFSNDPVAASLAASAEHAEKVGLLAHADLRGIYALGPLNQVLAGHGQTLIGA
jgi:NitT/TauT family transport system substrate-binding protein